MQDATQRNPNPSTKDLDSMTQEQLEDFLSKIEDDVYLGDVAALMYKAEQTQGDLKEYVSTRLFALTARDYGNVELALRHEAQAERILERMSARTQVEPLF